MLIVVSYISLAIAGMKCSFDLRSSSPRRDLLYATWLVLAICMIALQWTTTAPPNFDLYGDFNDAYYLAGKQVLKDPALMYAPPEHGLQFVNLPITALLFVPLSTLDETTAGILFLVLGIMAIIAAYFLLIQLTNASGWQKLAIATLFIINGPLHYSLRIGNTSHFVLLALVATLAYLHKKQYFRAGVIIAIAALIKLPLLLLGVYFCVRQRWRVGLGFSITLVTIFVTSFLLLGASSHKNWLKFSIVAFKNKVITAFNAQSISSFLARLTMEGDFQSWVPMSVDQSFKLLSGMLVALVIGVVIYYLWQAKLPVTIEQENTEFSIVLCLALSISTISWSHYHLWLLIPMVLYFSKQLIMPKNSIFRVLTLIGVLLVSPPTLEVKSTISTRHDLISNLLASHYLFGTLLLMSLMLVARYAHASLPLIDQAALSARSNSHDQRA
jgi:Glycosyltransferase family 87